MHQAKEKARERERKNKQIRGADTFNKKNEWQRQLHAKNDNVQMNE